MTENKISHKILETIKEKNIKPKPKWEFLLKDYLIWSLFGFCLVVGALATSVVIFLLVNNDWDLYKYASGNFFEFFFITLPYFWLIIFAVFTVVAFYNFKYTKKGYLLSLSKIIGLCLFLSFVLGGVVYAAGFGKMLDSALSNNLPYYNNLHEHRREIWNQPRRGMLAGVITEAEQEKFNLLDVRGEHRCVDCQTAQICEFAQKHVGKNVKVMGDGQEPCFVGKMIRLWREGMMNPEDCFFREEGEAPRRMNRCQEMMK